MRGRGTLGGEGLGSSGDKVGRWLLLLGAAALVLGLGGIHPAVLFSAAPVCLFGCWLIVRGQSRDAVPKTALVLFGLALYSALQAIPLPLGVLSWVSPTASDVWSRSLRPFGETVTSGSLSLDPGASLTEALKWFCYGAVLFACSVITRRSGEIVCALAVFCAALLVAAVTIGHGLVDASSVFGVYQPKLATSRWHIGPLLNPNTLSGYLNLGAFVGLGLSLSRRARRYSWLLASGAAFLFATSALSGSRGGLAGIALGLLGFATFLVTRRRSGGARRAAVLLGVGLGASLLGWLGARSYLMTELGERGTEKLAVFRESLQLIRDFPIFGVGRGAFESAFQAYTPSPGNVVWSHAENFVLQWLCEWGIPVALTALVALVAPLFGRRARRDGASARAGIVAGIVALAFQNLFDLGLELPGVALTLAALVPCLGEPESERFSQWVPALRGAGQWLVAGGMLVFGAAFFGGSSPVLFERESLGVRARRLDARDQSAVRAFRSDLRAAMRRHPAEPYFARLGANLALDSKDSGALTWVQLALERGPLSGRAHLLAARAVMARGATEQALFELRLAAQYDSDLAKQVGVLAAAWARSPERLGPAVPEGPAGATVLYGAGRGFLRRDERAFAERCFRLALERDPGHVPATRELARALLARFSETGAQRAPGLFEEALEASRRLARLTPSAAEPAILESQILSQDGRWDESARKLEQACPNLADNEAVRCAFELFRTLLATPEGRRAKALRAAESFGALCRRQTCDHLMLLQVGDALSGVREWLHAAAIYQIAVERDPRPSSLMRLAEALARSGQVAAALRSLERAERFSGNDAALRAQIQTERNQLQRKIVGHWADSD